MRLKEGHIGIGASTALFIAASATLAKTIPEASKPNPDRAVPGVLQRYAGQFAHRSIATTPERTRSSSARTDLLSAAACLGLVYGMIGAVCSYESLTRSRQEQGAHAADTQDQQDILDTA
ncbi:MAG TPA: hypothetical protein VK712_00120 [Verrucomicrobiae bacterium]|jgi:hypothetical protein|nr:hypothetical protein [Verrucomicrobiae bacterium]